MFDHWGTIKRWLSFSRNSTGYNGYNGVPFSQVLCWSAAPAIIPFYISTLLPYQTNG
jgi:hypothetical protein